MRRLTLLLLALGAALLLLKPRRPAPAPILAPLIDPYAHPADQHAQVRARLKDLRARIVTIRKTAAESNDYYLSLYAIHLEDETDAIEAEYIEQYGGG